MFSAILDFVGGSMRNRSEAKESARNRSFQQQMSSTAYQRSMADMKAAGLNPIMAGKLGGASTPGGSKANFGNPTEGAASKIQQAQLTKALVQKAQAEANSASQLAIQNKMDTDNLRAQGLSPMQMKHTGLNQATSMAVDGAVSTAKGLKTLVDNPSETLKQLEQRLPVYLRGDKNFKRVQAELEDFFFDLQKEVKK